MNDQISRQKLIEELETEYEGYKNLYCKTFDSEYRGRMDGIDIAIKVVDDQPPADQQTSGFRAVAVSYQKCRRWFKSL